MRPLDMTKSLENKVGREWIMRYINCDVLNLRDSLREDKFYRVRPKYYSVIRSGRAIIVL